MFSPTVRFASPPLIFSCTSSVDTGESRPGRQSASESLTFSFAVQSEPKLPLLGVGQATLTAAFDSDKNSMLIPSNANEYNEWDGRHINRHSTVTATATACGTCKRRST